MTSSSELSVQLWKHFDNVEDPRITYLIDHKLIDIITLTICAVICGAETWEQIEEYGQSKYQWLKTFLELPNGIPSHDTISRLFARLSPEQLQDSFLSWIQAIAQLTEGEVIAIDGKTLRHSYNKEKNKGAIQMVSAWATQNHLVLGQVKVDEKSNEITAIPKLLEILDLRGCIVTIDAMGCQKEIATQIIERDGDYVLSLKGNQGNIHQDVEQLFDWAIKNDWKNMPHERYQKIEKGHGRIEIRRYWLMNSVEELIDGDLWTGLKTMGMVESQRKITGKETTVERRYYLSSLDSGIEKFAQAVRSHWQIENQLHWCLDVSFNEDNSRIRSGHSAENMAVIRHIALNLISQDKSCSVGKKTKRLKAGWDNDYLLKLLCS